MNSSFCENSALEHNISIMHEQTGSDHKKIHRLNKTKDFFNQANFYHKY